MQRILTDSPDVVAGFRELILQPQSELWQFRCFMREQGFRVADENILCEDGKYYFLFRVDLGHKVNGLDDMGQLGRLGDKYGALLLQRRHPVLQEYLEKQLKNCQTVREKLLSSQGAQGGNRRLEQSLSENEAEIMDLKAALALYMHRGT